MMVNRKTEIGIVGAGMSGLFSGYLLDNAGFHNYEIIEANDRLGGYVPEFSHLLFLTYTHTNISV